MEVELDGMLGPVATPVVVQAERQVLVSLIHPLRQEILHTGVLGEGNVRADVEVEAAIVTERRRVAAIVRVLVVHHGRQALGVKPVSGTEPGHSGSKNNDVGH